MTLIERLEAASGAAFAFDAAIARACGYTSWPPPAYTASLDAAMTLVPEGLHWTGQTDRDGAIMRVGKADSDARGIFYTDCTKGEGRTPALALCIAALKARGVQ